MAKTKQKTTASAVPEYNFHDIVFGDGDYASIKKQFMSQILEDYDGFRNEKCRVYLDKEHTIDTTNKELVVNLILLQFMEGQDEEVIQEIYKHIHEIWYTSEKFGSDICKFWDNMLPIIENIKDIDTAQLNYSVSEVMSEFGDYSILVGMAFGATINLYSFMKAIDEDPELKELTSGDLTGFSEYTEIEKELTRRRKRFEEIIKEKHPDLDLFLQCNNKGQYEQMFIGMGAKADIYGKMFEHVPATNFLKGMTNVMDFYILSQVTRKILITSHNSVSSSGYLAKKLGLLLCDTTLSKVKDCKTKHLLPMVITEKRLKHLRGRYYKTSLKQKGYSVIEGTETNLLGKTIYLRSPITCACKKGICQTCYGELSKINKKFHIGELAALIISSLITQNLLSTKHHNRAKAPEYNWPKEVLDMFVIEKSSVLPAPNASGTIFIPEADMMEDEDTGFLYTDFIEIVQRGRGKNVRVKLPDSFWLTSDAMESLADNKVSDGYELRLKDFEDVPIFELLVRSEELTGSLNRIKKIIDTNDHMNVGETYEEVFEAVMGILEHHNFPISAVHVELVISAMLSDADGVNKPDFSKEDVSYIIHRLSGRILDRDTVTPALAFEQINAQLNNPAILKKKGKSSYDVFFS